MAAAEQCQEKWRLVVAVQDPITRILQLLRLEREAIEDEAIHLTHAIEEEITRERLLKERAVAALRHHRIRHGC